MESALDGLAVNYIQHIGGILPPVNTLAEVKMDDLVSFCCFKFLFSVFIFIKYFEKGLYRNAPCAACPSASFARVAKHRNPLALHNTYSSQLKAKRK